jgi:hypothetical protein
MQFSIDTLQVRQSNLLVENHLIHAGDEVGVEEATMEDSQADHTSNEFEVIQMLWVDA